MLDDKQRNRFETPATATFGSYQWSQRCRNQVRRWNVQEVYTWRCNDE